jgi:HSP20 family molecular chaperone IbpA
MPRDPEDRPESLPESAQTRSWEISASNFPSAGQIERRFEELIRGRWVSDVISPPVDVFVYEEEVRIEVDLPGVEEERVRVQLEGTVLLIEAERSEAPARGASRAERIERPRGLLRRRVPLPRPVAMPRVETQLHAGVLIVRVRSERER